ncbi:MAG: TetR/AcrR family transcriptional regulator [Gammaproteobacteria bacterium]|nr:TetR/AcrR family transcriptional regulator [Gammaproteobacteria bacterium]MCP5136385.1 TetR/AcrR family transcriptional regulator [Gammaproteobacteria bacterium]
MLRQAMLEFWKHGYEGTSMTRLVEAMGIGSPSIYATFGSKENLFREAVGMYIAEEVSPAWQALEEIEDTHLAVKTMIFRGIDTFSTAESPRGCLIVLGAANLGGAEDSVRAFLRNLRREFHDHLGARMQRGIRDGDVDESNDPSVLSECVIAFFAGLAIEAVDGTGQDALRRSAEFFCERLFKP